VSLSAFSFLLSEMVQHAQARVTSIDALERRLEEAGYSVGLRVLELHCLRDRSGAKRRTRLLQALQWVSADMWRALFGKTADSLERSTENADEYMIHELQPITNVFVSVPPDMGQVRSTPESCNSSSRPYCSTRQHKRRCVDSCCSRVAVAHVTGACTGPEGIAPRQADGTVASILQRVIARQCAFDKRALALRMLPLV
jgi:Transport protein particle (TRAPP) component